MIRLYLLQVGFDAYQTMGFHIPFHLLKEMQNGYTKSCMWFMYELGVPATQNSLRIVDAQNRLVFFG